MSEYNETPLQIPISISKDQTGEKPQLPEKVKIALEILRLMEIKPVEVTDGVWNESDEETKKRTGVEGVYVTTERERLPEGEALVIQTFYRVKKGGVVEVETFRHKESLRVNEYGNFEARFEPVMERKSLFSPPAFRIGAQLLRDEKDPDKVVGLKFLELRFKKPQKAEPQKPSPTPPPSE